MSEWLLQTPDPLEFLEFFGVEPVVAEPASRFFAYQIADANGTQLRFSFDGDEGSVQTVMTFGRSKICVCSEHGREIRIDGCELTATFESPASRTRLRLRLGESIDCDWSTLEER